MKLKTLSMPTLHIHTKVEKNGIILSEKHQVGHSWVRNAYNAYNLMMLDSLPTTYLFVRSTNGVFNTTRVPVRNSPNATFAGCGYYSTANSVDYGIVLGIGTTAFNLDDFRLETVIPHGNTSGALYYQAQVAPVTAYSGDPDFTQNILHKRVFNNNSGATITVNEVGLIFSDWYYNGTTYYYLMSRDILDTPAVVLNGAQLTVTVSITTKDFAATDPGVPALGTLGSGGIYIGQFDYTVAQQTPGSHRRYGLILSPITGGESTTLAWRSTPTATNCQDMYYGQANTTVMEALGAASPAGAFCTAENTAVLGGFSDWYIPTYYEMGILYTNRAYIPGGQELSNANYWTSYCANNTNASAYNPTTNAYATQAQNTANKVRLIRRFLIADWVAD
jgi:hypothetical protein